MKRFSVLITLRELKKFWREVEFFIYVRNAQGAYPHGLTPCVFFHNTF